MTFAEAKMEYCRIKNQLKNNSISHEEYIGRINDLKVQDEAGNWYQINEADGSWMLWDGQAWISYSVPRVITRDEVTSGAKVASNQHNASKADQGAGPESLWKFLVSLIKGFLGIYRK